jgi:hypothetical protein
MPIKQPVMTLRFLADNKQSGLLGLKRGKTPGVDNSEALQVAITSDRAKGLQGLSIS